VVLVAFGDFQCEACRTQASELENALTVLGADASRVGVVWRDIPLVNQHERAMSAAVAAQCAARQGRFRQMHDALFFQSKDLSDAEILGFVDLLRLNKDQFLSCLRDPAITFRLQRDLEDARTHGITSVPIIFVNGTPVDGLVDANTLVALVKRELSVAKP
jgi:protein-disulfide isomerase